MTEISLDPPPNCRYILFSCLDEFLKWFLVLNFIVKAITLLFRALAYLPTMPCYTRKWFFFSEFSRLLLFFYLVKVWFNVELFWFEKWLHAIWVSVARETFEVVCVRGIINFSFSEIFPYTLNGWSLLWYNESTREKIIYFKHFFAEQSTLHC